jgi:F-type H+-transporting ATPase subunit delta
MARLSARYASALFDLAIGSGNPDEYFEQAVFLRDTLCGTDYRHIITHPQIPTARKLELIDEAFADRIHADLCGFLCLAVSKNRESFIIPGLEEFIRMMDEHNGMVTANVVCATELGENQTADLKALLEKKLGKKVSIETSVDKSVLGGFRILMDGYFIDRTIRKQLHDMKASLQRSIAHDS